MSANGRRAGWATRAAAHGVGAALAAAGLFFTAWALMLPPLREILFPWPLTFFSQLLERWAWGGGSLDTRGLAFGLAAIAVLTVIGTFILECFELYLPAAARLALAYLLGLGIGGVVLEWLAIPHLLSRETMALALGGLLLALMVGAWWRGRRPPETGAGGEADFAAQQMRHSLARQAWRARIERPRGAGWLFTVAAAGLLVAITLCIFWHAVLYPEVYWDSLILYMGYARMTFLEGGFPVKVVGQVGIGLGANYPHLYAALGAGVATASGEWSDLPQRMMAPLAGLASTVLVYHGALRLTRHVNMALAVALLYRATPLAIIYDQYGSDYALAILFMAGFLYLALLFVQTGMRGAFALATLTIALAMHLNYLMGILWLGWVLMIVAAHPLRGRETALDPVAEDAPWTCHGRRPGVLRFLFSGTCLGWLLVAVVVASTWYVRNWVVTGNPVYAFFYEQLGGKNVNPEVMRWSEREWIANGVGIARLDELFPNRWLAAWSYFTGLTPAGDDGVRLGWPQANQLAPLMLGFALPAALIWLGALLAWPLARRKGCGRAPGRLGFGLVAAGLAAALVAFHFILAPFYLYQISMIVPALALLVAVAWPAWSPRPWRWVLGGTVLATGALIGLPWGMVGFKVTGPFTLEGGRVESPWTLYVLRHPLPVPERFMAWRYGDDVTMWSYVNRHLPGQRLLTHENRHLVFDPTIKLVHLDDWEMQALWEVEPARERVRRLMEEEGIFYYLYVPNERAMDKQGELSTNQRMGTARWEEEGLAELEFEAGENRLYRLRLPAVEDAATSGGE